MYNIPISMSMSIYFYSIENSFPFKQLNIKKKDELWCMFYVVVIVYILNK